MVSNSIRGWRRSICWRRRRRRGWRRRSNKDKGQI